MRKRGWTTCIVLYDERLAELARIIGATYEPGSLDRAFDEMYERDEWDADWELVGEHARFLVRVERAESYLFCTLHGDTPQAQEAREFLYRAYLASGGNPDEQPPP